MIMLSLDCWNGNYGCANEKKKFDLKGANKITGNIKCIAMSSAQFGNLAQNTLCKI
jgi:hypothetical protein